MKKLKSWVKIILGCLLIGTTLNLFFHDFNLVPNGIFGFSMLFTFKYEYPLFAIYFLINIFIMLVGLLVGKQKHVKKLIIPVILISLFTFITTNVGQIIDIRGADNFLIAIYAGVLMGLGIRLIYKEKMYSNSIDIVKVICKDIIKTKSEYIPYFFDFIWLIFSWINLGVNATLYSFISILIIETLSRRATLGVSDSKVFYIITKKEKEMKEYIKETYNFNITEFDVKGGFTQNKNKVLMTVIPTRKYYEFKEGIKKIDSDVFISITDSYEVIKNTKVKK